MILPTPPIIPFQSVADIELSEMPHSFDRSKMRPEAHEMFCRIPDRDWAVIERKISTLTKGNPDPVLEAMYQFIQGEMSLKNYCRSMLHHDCLSMDPNLRVLNKWDILSKWESLSLAFSKTFSPKVLEDFKESLTDEDQIFAVTIAPHAPQSLSMWERTQKFLPHFILENTDILSTWLAFPPDLIDRLYQFQFGPQAARSNPVHGYSSPHHFENPEIRDVYLPNPFVSRPKKVHSFPIAFDAQIYYLDSNYHLYLDSINPDRKFIIEVAKAYKSKNQGIYERLIDRELTHYYLERDSLSTFSNRKRLAFTLLIIMQIIGSKNFLLLENWLNANSEDLKNKYEFDFNMFKEMQSESLIAMNQALYNFRN